MLIVSCGKEEHRAALVWDGAQELRNRKAHVAFPIIMENQCFIKNLDRLMTIKIHLFFGEFRQCDMPLKGLEGI